MLKTIRKKMTWLLAATVLAACSVGRVFAPVTALPGKPLVVIICGFSETPGQSWTDPLAASLRSKGYTVRQYEWDRVPAWYSDEPVVVIGFSYGGDTACRFSAAGCRVDRLILLNPVEQGALWHQGQPLHIGHVRQVEVYATYDAFPRASTRVIDSAGNEYHAEMVPGETHTSLVPAVQEKIMKSF